jgi:hypothetical protein
MDYQNRLSVGFYTSAHRYKVLEASRLTAAQAC